MNDPKIHSKRVPTRFQNEFRNKINPGRHLSLNNDGVNIYIPINNCNLNKKMFFEKVGNPAIKMGISKI